MTIWNNSKMTTLFYTEESASENFPCVVKIDDEEILVEYDDDGLVQYRGKNEGNGHFHLYAPDVDGNASLHRFPNCLFLEGSWFESSYRGMWRIELA